MALQWSLETLSKTARENVLCHRQRQRQVATLNTHEYYVAIKKWPNVTSG